MKAVRRIFGILLSIVMLCSMTIPALAKEEYRYTVRFYAGQQGLIGGGEVITFTNLKYGERVTFNQNMVTLKDEKYYVKGIRESGMDNNTVRVNSFPVTADKDYVVAYGLLNDAVAYTINYVDENGNALAPSEQYYGNRGDKPVIAYLYIEGYQPQAYNLTGTLTDDPAENVFTFVYTPIGRVTTVITDVVEGEEGGGGGGEGDGQGDQGEEIFDNLIPRGANEPENLVDIDEKKIPLANFFKNNGMEVLADGVLLLAGIPAAAKISFAIIFGAGGMAGIWMFVIYRNKRKRKEAKKEEKENEE